MATTTRRMKSLNMATEAWGWTKRERRRLLSSDVLVLLLAILSSFNVTAFFKPRTILPTPTVPRRTFQPMPLHPSPMVPVTSFSSRMMQPTFLGSRTALTGTFLDAVPMSTTEFPFPILEPLHDIVTGLLEPVPGLEQSSVLAIVAANLVSIPFWAKFTSALQRFGENTFVALVVLAFLQGGVAVFQYRTNPNGELMVPPGFTVGVEFPDKEENQKGNKEKLTRTIETNNNNNNTDLMSTLRSGAQSNTTERSTYNTGTNGDVNGSNLTKDNKKQGQSRYAATLQRINRFLIVLIPWLFSRAGFILQRNSHLLHIGSILTLTSVFDFPQSFFTNNNQSKQSSIPLMSEELSLFKGKEEHIVVIGDSLAVGLGSVDQFDKNKTNDIPFQRIENIPQGVSLEGKKKYGSTSDKQGPAFPQALAKTLSQKLQKRVTWRSAGVDGGAIPQIQEYLLDVIKEEVNRGKPPDCVVLLCGANDMKYFLSNPFKKDNWPRAFRSKLTSFLQEIRALAPNTTILLPAFPTQMFHKNSPINVFPLGILVDTMAGFWDSLKKNVADCFPSEGVVYIGLSPKEVGQWYHDTPVEVDEPWDPRKTMHNLLDDMKTLDEGEEPPNNAVTLIAIDGVHPNFRCYSKWAETIGSKLVAKVAAPKRGFVKQESDLH